MNLPRFLLVVSMLQVNLSLIAAATFEPPLLAVPPETSNVMVDELIVDAEELPHGAVVSELTAEASIGHLRFREPPRFYSAGCRDYPPCRRLGCFYKLTNWW